MRKLMICILSACALFAINTGCKKKTNDNPGTTTVDSAALLADTLRATCTAPFVGHGDSTNVYLPTAFSPNGDGINDLYTFITYKTSAVFLSSLSMKIYDTTGHLVYMSSNPSVTTWDGTDQTTNARSTKYKFYVRVKYTTTGNKSDSGNTYVYLLNGTTCVHVVASDTAKYRFPTQFDFATGYNSSWPSFETYCH